MRSGDRECGSGSVGNGVHGCGGSVDLDRWCEEEADCYGGKDCYCEECRCELKCGLKDVSEVCLSISGFS